jgi:hypothetical protein
VTAFQTRVPAFSIALLMVVLGATPTMMSAAMDRGYDLTKQIVSMPLLFLALATMAVAVPRELEKWQGGGREGAARWGWPLVGAWLAMLLASTLFSERPAMSIYGSYWRHEGLLAWLSFAAAGMVAYLAVCHFSGVALLRVATEVMVLAAVVPVLDACLQRYGLGRYFTPSLDWSRPSGTFGNPLFLAAYCAMLLPLALGRLWQSWRSLGERWVWVLATAVLLAGLLVTQSRGPLLALVAGGGVMMALMAVRLRRPALLGTVFAVGAASAALLVTLNTQTPMRDWAQQAPVLARLVVMPGEARSQSTQMAVRSTNARLHAWAMGNEVWPRASLARQLLGFGPEVAYMQYYPHVSLDLLRAEGFAESNTFDRLHAETLDMILNHGVLAWLMYVVLFGAAIFSATSILLGRGSRYGAAHFSAAGVVGAGMGAAGALAVGFPSAMMPAFGLGLGVGWAGYIVIRAWGGARRIDGEQSALGESWPLLAGTVAALFVFWFDAQINIPIPTTRIVEFVLIGTIFGVAGWGVRSRRVPADDDATGTTALQCGTAAILVAAVAAFWPIADLDPALRATGQRNVLWTAFPPLSALALMLVLLHLRSQAGQALWRASIVVSGVAAYVALHALMLVPVSKEFAQGEVLRIALGSVIVPITVALMVLVLVWRTPIATTSGGAKLHVDEDVSPAWMAGAVAFGLAIASSVISWQLIRGEVSATWARLASGLGNRHLAESLAIEAFSAVPHERHYRRKVLEDMLLLSLKDVLGKSGRQVDAEHLASNMVTALALAEDTLRLYPTDPWVAMDLARVYQLLASPPVRALDPASGARAETAARKHFSQAHALFSAQPEILGNWGQFEFMVGNVAAGHRLFDEMEQRSPTSVEPYRTRLESMPPDTESRRQVLERAARNLPPDRAISLSTVGIAQQAR